MAQTTVRVIGETESEAKRRRQRENAAKIAAPKNTSQSYSVYSEDTASPQDVASASRGSIRIKDAQGKYRDVVVAKEGIMSIDTYQKTHAAAPETKATYKVTSTSEARPEELRPVQQGTLRIKDRQGNYQNLVVTKEGVMSENTARTTGVNLEEPEPNQQQVLATGRMVYSTLRAKQLDMQPFENTVGSPYLQLNPDVAIEKRSSTFTALEWVPPPREIRPLTKEETRAYNVQKFWDKIIGKKRAIEFEQGYAGYQDNMQKVTEFTDRLPPFNLIGKIQGVDAGSQAVRGVLRGSKVLVVDYPIWLPGVANLRFAGETVLSGGKNIIDIGAGVGKGFANPATRIETGAALTTIAVGPRVGEIITRPVRNYYVGLGAKQSVTTEVSPQILEEGKTFPVSSSLHETIGAFKESRFSNPDNTVEAMLGRREPYRGIRARYKLSFDGFRPRLTKSYEFVPDKAFAPVTETDIQMARYYGLKEVNIATHASTGGMLKGKVEPGPMGSLGKEDPILFLAPSKHTSSLFFRIDSGAYSFLPNPIGDLIPKGAKAHSFYYSSLERYPRGVIQAKGYTKIRGFLQSRKNTGEIFITKRHELGLGLVRDRTQSGSNEMEAGIGLGNDIRSLSRGEWGFLPRTKGYRQYLTYKGHRIPIYEYLHLGKTYRPSRIAKEFAGEKRLTEEYGPYSKYRVKNIGKYFGYRVSSKPKYGSRPRPQISNSIAGSSQILSRSRSSSISKSYSVSRLSRVSILRNRPYTKYRYSRTSYLGSSLKSNYGVSRVTRFNSRLNNNYEDYRPSTIRRNVYGTRRGSTRTTQLTPPRPPRGPNQNAMEGAKGTKILDLWRGKRLWNIKTPQQMVFGKR